MIEVICSSLYTVNQQGGLKWHLHYHGKLYKLCLKFAILFLSGDNEGQHKFCGKYMPKTAQVSRICRTCNIPNEHTGDPHYKWRYYKMSELQKWVDKNDLDSLKDNSFHPVNNAFFSLPLCCSDRGILGLTPFDSLHTVKHGMIQMAIEQLVAQKKQKKNASSLSAAEKNLQKRNCVFSDSQKKVVDELSKFYGRTLTHQSDCNLPRTFFPQGICSNTKKAGHEQQGVLLLFLIAITCVNEVKYDNKQRIKSTNNLEVFMGEQHFGAYIVLLESLMLFEEWLKQDDFHLSQLRQFQKFLPLFLEFFHNTLNRTKGRGRNIIKPHIVLHLPDDIRRIGPPNCYDSALGESRHKTDAKAPAQRTQRRVDGFEKQLAQRYTENIVIERAMQEAFSDFLEADEEEYITLDRHDSIHVSKDTSCPIFEGQQYRFFEGKIFACQKAKNSKKYNTVHNIWPNQDHLSTFVGTCFSACYKLDMPPSV